MSNSTQMGMGYIEELLSQIKGVDFNPEDELAKKAAKIALLKGISVSYTNGKTLYTPRLNTNKEGLQIPRAVEIGLNKLGANIVMDVGYAKRGVIGVLSTLWQYQRSYYVEYLHVAKDVFVWTFGNRTTTYGNARLSMLQHLNTSLAQFSPIFKNVYNMLVATIPSCLPANKPKEYVACVIPI